MGFNIGSFLGSIAPFIGGALGGPIGTVIGTGVSAALAPSPRAVAVVGRQTQPVLQAPAVMTSVVPVPGVSISFGANGARQFGTGGFDVQRRRVGLTGLVSRGVGGAFGGAVIGLTVLSEILSRARENTGQRVTRNKIIDSARACGIELTAQTFGISESDVCKVIVQGRTRRRRGVSAADVRRTKRTLRFVRSIKKDLKAVRL